MDRDYNKKGKNYIIASIYRHSSKKDSEFHKYVQNTLDKLKNENKMLFITGDFNLNLLNTNKNMEVELFLESMYTN